MEKILIRLISIFKAIILLSSLTNAQCTITGPFPVNDFDVYDLTLEITGLSNNDLSDPNQGICGVAIEFQHERVGNLLIEMTSPSGEVVTLVGPNGPFGLTSFTNWDISFLPCGSSVNPDLGFGPFYTNQNSWGNFGNYTGSYYPFDGCLEDFNNGSANGDWTFTIRDAYLFDEGVIESITLFFCDPTGLECQECGVPDISIDEDSLSYCDTDLPSDTLNWNIGSNFNAEFHQYAFIFTVNDTIQDVLFEPVIPIVNSEGIYKLCGFTYASEDSAEISTILTNGVQLTVAIDSLEILDVCYYLSDSCTDIYISQVEPPQMIDTSFCPADTIFWLSDTITEVGQYTIIDSISQVCDVTYQIDVSEIELHAEISGLGDLNCDTPSRIIDATPSTLTSNTSVEWYAGSDLIAVDTLQIQVTDSGQYRLVLQEQNCADTLHFTVDADFDQPYVDLGTIDTLSCNRDSIVIILDSLNADSIYYVSFSGDTLTTPVITVTAPDTFYYVAIASNGCELRDTFHVIGDSRMVDLAIDTTVNLCGTDTIFLRLFDADTIHLYSWQGPNGFEAHSRDTFSLDQGIYIVSATHYESNCVTIDSFEYFLDPAIDTPDIHSDTLDCINDKIQFQLDSVHGNYNYQWYSQNGDTITGSEPFVSEAGNYTLEIKASENCHIQLQHEVIQSFNLPEVEITADSLNCSGRQALLVAFASPIDSAYTFEWEGPNGQSLIGDSVFVSVPGIYILTLTKDSSCQLLDSFEVVENFNAFRHIFSADTITCKDSVSNVEITGPDTFSYAWTGPDSSSYSGKQFSTQTPGIYEVEINTGNCIYFRSVAVDADVQIPQWQLEFSQINCLNDSATVIHNSDNDSLWLYSTDSLKYIYLPDNVYKTPEAGEYQFRLKSENGCTNDTLLEVVIDTFPREFQVHFSDTLDCNTDSILSNIVLNEPPASIQWYQGGGQIGDRDSLWIINANDISLEMVFQNGCSFDTVFSLPLDTIAPKPEFSLQALNCEREEYSLSFSFDTPVDSVFWNTPNGVFTTTDTLVQITKDGEYGFRIYGSNGCEVDSAFTVLQDTSLPVPVFSNDTVGCNENNTQVEVALDTSALSDYYWQLDDGTTLPQLAPQLPVGNHVFYLVGNNGCKDSIQKEIYKEIFTPDVNMLSDSIILNCIDTAIDLAPQLPSEVDSFLWHLPNGNIAFSQIIRVDTPGQYELVLFNVRNCSDTMSGWVGIDTVPPNLQLFEDTLSCAQASLQLKSNTSADSAVYTWNGPEGFQSSEVSPLITSGGLYTLEITDSKGCSKRDSVNIAEDFDLPDYNLRDTIYSSCNTDSAIVKVSTMENTISWYHNNQLISASDSFVTTEKGIFRMIIEGQNGCRAVDSVWVSAIGKPLVAEWAAPVLTCNNPIDTLALIFADGNYQYFWQGPDGFSSNNASPIIQSGGEFTVVVEDDQGCISMDTIEVEQLSLPLHIDIQVLDEIRCEDSITGLEAIISRELKDSAYMWTALEGSILSGVFTNAPQVKGPGVFIIEVRDSVDGCLATDTVSIERQPKPDLTIDAMIQDIFCERDSAAFIHLLPRDSSRAPFTYSIENGHFTMRDKFTNLQAGTYNFEVRDRQGCIYSESYMIVDQSSVTHVMLGEDLELDPGSEITIYPSLDFTSQIIDSIVWIENGRVACRNCDSLSVLIDGSKKIEVYIYTMGGCIFYDQLNIQVPVDDVLFVPNIFSPNNDNENDIFYIQTGLDIPEITHLQIMDRWGNQVFEARNFPPNERAFGWDGTFEGQPLFPQVFAVRIVYTYEGEEKIEHFDLMLIR